MVTEIYVNVERTFLYWAKADATGATCYFRAVKVSDGTKTVDDAAMTEVSAANAPGLNRYAWTPTETGYYAVYSFEGLFSNPTKLTKGLVEVIG